MIDIIYKSFIENGNEIHEATKNNHVKKLVSCMKFTVDVSLGTKNLTESRVYSKVDLTALLAKSE